MVFGNLTRDPEMKALPSGSNVTSMSIATNRKFKDRDGNMQEQVEYHNIVIFGKQAETTAQYLKKGSSAYVEGRLQTRSWDDKDSGKKMYRTEIVAERVQFGPKKGDGAPAQAQSTETKQEASAPEYPEDDINPDDIPF